jgi:hypothetical protein
MIFAPSAQLALVVLGRLGPVCLCGLYKQAVLFHDHADL